MKIKDILDYKKPVFWVAVTLIVSFLVLTVFILTFLPHGSDGGNRDKSDLNETQQDTLNTEEEHSYTSEITETATCTSAGTVTFTCEKCGDSYTESIEPTGHSYISAVVSEGNCSVKSVVAYTCSVCGDTYTEEGKLDPSIHSALISETSVYPTCTENGTKTTSCSGCGYAVTDTIPATGHSMSQVSCTATCTSDGVTEYRCNNCGLSNSEATAAFGHSFARATCTEPETCTRCGLSQGKRLGHNMHGGYCSICQNYIPLKNVVNISGTDQRIYLAKDDPELKDYYIIIRDCTVDYSNRQGAVINFVVDATNAILPDTINRLMYIARIIDDMTGEVVYDKPLFIWYGEDPITRDSVQLYLLTFYGDDIPEGDYTVSFVAYHYVY